MEREEDKSNLSTKCSPADVLLEEGCASGAHVPPTPSALLSSQFCISSSLHPSANVYEHMQSSSDSSFFNSFSSPPPRPPPPSCFSSSSSSSSSSVCEDGSSSSDFRPSSSFLRNRKKDEEQPKFKYFAGCENHNVHYCAKTRNLICQFKRKPQRILVIKRHDSTYVTHVAAQLTRYITSALGIKVIIEPLSVADMRAVGVSNILTWKKDSHLHDIIRLVDLVIAIGGDGTILWTSHLFPKRITPVVGIRMGSLGYLNQFDIKDVHNVLQKIVHKSYAVNLRGRLRVRVVNEKDEVEQELCAMNECIIDRGSSPFLTMLDVYCDGQFFTTVSADGLILATPTGSTAYSMSAGGAMVHPKVPCIIFTPVCPHSLSFRPVALPDTVTLRIAVPEDSRYNAWAAVDGRSRTEIKRGMSVLVSISPYPFPMVVTEDTDELDSWLRSLTKGLNWNQRIRQTPINVNSTTAPVNPQTAHFCGVFSNINDDDDDRTTALNAHNNFTNTKLSFTHGTWTPTSRAGGAENSYIPSVAPTPSSFEGGGGYSNFGGDAFLYAALSPSNSTPAARQNSTGEFAKGRSVSFGGETNLGENSKRTLGKTDEEEWGTSGKNDEQNTFEEEEKMLLVNIDHIQEENENSNDCNSNNDDSNTCTGKIEGGGGGRQAKKKEDNEHESTGNEQINCGGFKERNTREYYNSDTSLRSARKNSNYYYSSGDECDDARRKTAD